MKKMKKLFRTILSLFLAVSMLFGNLYIAEANETGLEEIKIKIPHNQTTGSSNYFTYSDTGWTISDAHSWSNIPSGDNPAATYYEVKFVGHKIDIYAGGNRPMGIVKYYIDGELVETAEVEDGEFDLYLPSNQDSRYITTIDGLNEGEHTFRAEATGKKSASATNTGIDAAEVFVYRYIDENATPQMAGSIVDENLQWTQDKYAELKDTTPVTTETLSAWKNDTVVSQIALLSVDSKVKNVKATASDFTGAAGTIAAENVELTFIKSVDAYTGMPGYGSTTRPVPEGGRAEANEVLYQDAATATTIGYNAVQNVWVSIQVPKNAAAGTYAGTVSVTADGLETPVTFNYNLEVADVELPDEETFGDSVETLGYEGFDIELWQNPFASAEYYGVEAFSEEHFAILTPIMKKYSDIGGYAITTTIVDDAWAGQTYSANEIKYPTMIEWIKKADGTWSFDYSKFDAWVSFCKEMGMGDKIVCYSIAPWNNQVTYYNEATQAKVTQALSTGSAVWTELWTAFLTDLIEHLNEKGWFEETYIGIDERGFDSRAFDLIDSIPNMAYAPNMVTLKTAGAMDGFVSKKDLAMRVDELSVGSIAVKDHPAEFEQIRQEREAKGLKTTIYTCTGHKPGSFSLSAPGESYWTMMYSIAVGGEGYMRWSYDSWTADPLRDSTHNAFEAGDCFLVYPDEKTAENPDVYSSTRLEKMAEGVRDVNKLMLMKAKVPGLEPQINALLATVKANYASGSYYLTEEGKRALAADMQVIKDTIADLTEVYVERLAGGTNEIESMEIAGGDTTVMAGESKQLNLTFQPETVLDTRVVWTSNNTAVATISETGVLTGVKAGVATITATSVLDPTKTDSIQVTVERMQVSEDKQFAYYSFDEDTAADAWGNRNGTVSGATFVEGKSGKAVQITEGNTITFAENTTLDHDWTVSYWVYLDEVPSARSSILASSDGRRTLNLRMPASGCAGVNVGTGSGDVLSFGNYTVTAGSWINMTWTNSASEGLKLYVNGELKQTNTWTINNSFKAPIDVIGGPGFVGMIDELKIYNCAITAEEVVANMQMKGLNVAQTQVEMLVGNTYQISTDLISDKEDKTITYTSENPEIASVDANGLVTAKKKGKVIVVVENAAGGYREEVTFNITKELENQYTIPQYHLPDEYLSDIMKDPYDAATDTVNRQYLGQPDMVMLDDEKTLYTVFPTGHGHGPLVMMKSTDAGETWTEKTDIPESWAHSMETPTLYKLDFQDGSQKLIMICARPNWGAGISVSGGWDTSISTDGGNTWSEFSRFHETNADGSQNWTVVAMSSLIHLKDENGNYIDKWMGVYHNGSTFVNYKTYLTFDENGNDCWTAPVPMMPEHRDIESATQLCEIGLFRSPDGSRIIGLARSQSHNHKSTMFYSDDEGETWSRPEYVQGALQGERHKAVYDPISGRLVITFREITLDTNGNGVIGEGWGDWMAGDWVAWVGTYEDLMESNEGQYRILLEEDWANNAKSGDTGYAGLVVTSDGTIITDSYGHWDKDFSLSWGGGVTTDLCYIKQAKFKLADIDNALGFVDKSELEAACQEMKKVQNNNYAPELWTAFETVLAKVEAALAGGNMQQVEIDALKAELDKAYKALHTHTPGEWIVDKAATTTEQGSKHTECTVCGTTVATEVIPVLPSGDTGNQDKPGTGDQGGNQDKPGTGDNTGSTTIKVGTTFKAGSYKYKVTGKTTVSVTGLSNTKTKKVKVSDTVKYKGKTFKVTAIANKAFKNKQITSVVIGKNVKTIGISAFEGCKKLNKVTMGANVTNIGDKAFKGCKVLKNITVPKKVTAIGKEAFANCSKLAKITISATSLKKVGKNAFKGIKSNATIKVPSKKFNAYKTLLKKSGLGKKVKIKK